MNSKRLVIVFTGILTLALCAAVQNAYSQSRRSGYRQLIQEKFNQKQRMILRNKDKLNLSDKQIEQVEVLKISLDKELVLQDAQIEVLNIDLQSMLAKDDIDISFVNKLIDRKFEFEKKKYKAQVKAYADLKSVLNENQFEIFKNMREIYKGPYREATSE